MSKTLCKTDDCRKAVHKAESLVNKAVAYKETHGYRENLGYDFDKELEEYMDTLSLTYTQRASILQHFYKLCDEI